MKRMMSLTLIASLFIAGTLTLLGQKIDSMMLTAHAEPAVQVKSIDSLMAMVQGAFQPAATVTIAPQRSSLGEEFKLENGNIIGYYRIPGGSQWQVYLNQTKIALLPAAEREMAESLVSDLSQYLHQGGTARNIRPGVEGNNVVIRAGEQILFTVNEALAKAAGQTRQELALSVSNQLRSALGVDSVRKPATVAASRGGSLFSRTRQTPAFRPSGILRSGFASWYGPGFHGRTAADGSTYNMYDYTAAHKTLPLGTFVRVLNQDTGKSVIVKITDRGPYVGDRVLDLSLQAADDIGMTEDGVAKVTYEVLVPSEAAA